MRVTISDDYAALDGDGWSLYYGYEVTQPDPHAEADEDPNVWCFQAKVGGREIIIPRHELLPSKWEPVEECLLAGIGLLIERGELVFREVSESGVIL